MHLGLIQNNYNTQGACLFTRQWSSYVYGVYLYHIHNSLAWMTRIRIRTCTCTYLHTLAYIIYLQGKERGKATQRPTLLPPPLSLFPFPRGAIWRGKYHIRKERKEKKHPWKRSFNKPALPRSEPPAGRFLITN